MVGMTEQALIAGGGIGGLAAALACVRAGLEVRLYEQAAAFSEVGAGIQLGPNVVRVLQGWGLQQALEEVVARPRALRVRSAESGALLGSLPLGEAMVRRYGAPYFTIHRADLHAVLLAAVQGPGVWLHTGATIDQYTDAAPDVVQLRLLSGQVVEGDLLVGADGLWSRVRQQWPGYQRARYTGHMAYRALLRQADLPASLRSDDVTVWLGQRLHLVQYPVRRGEWLNVAGFVEGPAPEDLSQWDLTPAADGLATALQGTAPALRALAEAVAQWRLWALCGRTPVAGPQDMVQGRVALLGDAAHPMLPYLAQGAGMAIEDAAELGRALAMTDIDLPLRLQRYALNRWQRNARVQRRSQRNGVIFHAQGPVRWGRDLSLRLLGQRLLDMPWLYGAGAA